MNLLLPISRRAALLGALLAGTLLAAPAAPTLPADQAWDQIRALINAGPGDPKGKSRTEIAQWFEHREEELREHNLAFYENYPGDPRRWEAALTLLQRAPHFIKAWDAHGAPVIDEAAAARWRERCREIEAEMQQAFPTLPRPIQERVEARPIFAAIGATYGRLERKEPVDWAGLRARVDAHLARYPDVPAIAGLVSRYLGMFERDHPAQETAAEWRALTVNPLVRRNEMIARRLEVIERETGKPMALAFTAADGRAVDLAKLRGKVVLIDFWATWCGPCVAELPNVRRVYQAYHDRGFEVIGISLENADLKPGDSPAQAAAKHAAARQKLLDFTRDRQIPWPQYYDGKYWDNDIARGRFHLNSIPATFLLDRTGTVAVVGVRGPQLEVEVRKLLGL